MNRTMNRMGTAWMLALALAGLIGLGGCNKEIKEENQALHVQNEELENELANSRNALDSANAELARMQQAQVDALNAKPGSGSEGLGGLEGGGVDVTENNGETTISVAGDVLFDSGQATLKSSFKSKLREIASRLSSGGYAEIRIEGHTDADPIKKTASKWRDNYHLSEARATAVRDYLAEQGVPRSSMSINGFGDTKPIANNSSKDGKAQNRRVEIVVVTG